VHRGFAVVVTASCLVGACADGEDAATPTTATTTTATTTTVPAPVEGLVATVATNRLYVVDHAFGVGLQNVGAVPVAVQRIRLDSGLFEPADPGDQSVQLQAGGRRFVLPAPYGPPRCGDAAEPSFAVDVVLADGREVHVPATEEFPGAIVRLHERECFTVEVHERVDFRLGDDWTQDGTAIHGELRLEQRHPGDAVAVDDVRGNVIFTVSADAVRVDDDHPSARVPITISADRCDPHAVAEFKRPYVLLAYVVVGDGEPTAVELEATGAARAAFQALIASCSTGS
jgi:hypothetical protein